MSQAPAGALETWLPQVGTDRYYAQLYCPPGPRQALALIEALRGEIARIPASCSSPTVALPKLAWWREELAHLQRGSPRHAITRALGNQIPDLPGAALALVSGVESLLGGYAHASRADRRAALLGAHGPLWACALAASQPAGKPGSAQALQCAALVEEAYALRDARPLLEGGFSLVAQDSVATSVAQHGVLPVLPGAWHAAVLGVDIECTLTDLRQHLAQLSDRQALRPLATLARLAIATLEEVRAGGCRVWETRVELTPLRKLWLAWRERAGL